MTFAQIDEPQPPVKKWVDPDVPGVQGTLVNGDAFIEFETEYGNNFTRIPIRSIPNVVLALVAVYNDNLPVDPPEEPTDPEDPPVDAGTGEEDPTTPVDEGTGSEEPSEPQP